MNYITKGINRLFYFIHAADQGKDKLQTIARLSQEKTEYPNLLAHDDEGQ